MIFQMPNQPCIPRGGKKSIHFVWMYYPFLCFGEFCLLMPAGNFRIYVHEGYQSACFLLISCLVLVPGYCRPRKVRQEELLPLPASERYRVEGAPRCVAEQAGGDAAWLGSPRAWGSPPRSSPGLGRAPGSLWMLPPILTPHTASTQSPRPVLCSGCRGPPRRRTASPFPLTT